MQSDQDKALNKEPARRSNRPRFRIDKLEERIAPAKGGIPGKPAYHYPPGQTCYYGFCCGPGHSQKGGCDL